MAQPPRSATQVENPSAADLRDPDLRDPDPRTPDPRAQDLPARDLPADDSEPVFDRSEEDLPWPQDDTLPSDDEGNILPGNDPLDEDPNDNGAEEQFDPEDIRRRQALGEPLQD